MSTFFVAADPAETSEYTGAYQDNDHYNNYNPPYPVISAPETQTKASFFFCHPPHSLQGYYRIFLFKVFYPLITLYYHTVVFVTRTKSHLRQFEI